MKPHRSYSDHEIACYVLGLDAAERTQAIQARLATDDAAAARALKWEAYFLSIVDALPPSPPPPALLAQIQSTLGMQAFSTTAEPRNPAAEAEFQPPSPGAEADRAEPRRQLGRPRPRIAATIGIFVAASLAVLLAWASLRPIGPSTIIQQDIHLTPQDHS